MSQIAKKRIRETKKQKRQKQKQIEKQIMMYQPKQTKIWFKTIHKQTKRKRKEKETIFPVWFWEGQKK